MIQHQEPGVAWLRNQMRAAVAAACDALAVYRETAGIAHLASCQWQLRRIAGVLGTTGCRSGAMLLEDMQAVVSVLDEKPEIREVACEILNRCLADLPVYVARVQSGEVDDALSQIGPLNDLRALRSEFLLKETMPRQVWLRSLHKGEPGAELSSQWAADRGSLLDSASRAGILGYRAGQRLGELRSSLRDVEAVTGRLQDQARRLDLAVSDHAGRSKPDGAAPGGRSSDLRVQQLVQDFGASLADLHGLSASLASTTQDAELLLWQQAGQHAELQKRLVSVIHEAWSDYSVERVALVAVADEVFALPLRDLHGATCIKANDLTELAESPGRLFSHNGQAYELRYLGSLLSPRMHSQRAAAARPLMLTSSEGRWCAIQVDALLGHRETVIKAGPHPVWGGVGTVMIADGSSVSVLDLHGLLREPLEQKGF